MAERLLAILTLLTVLTVMATIRISNDSRRLLFSRFDDECQISFCYTGFICPMGKKLQFPETHQLQFQEWRKSSHSQSGNK
ncbi:Hypothetical predicted protein [Octopus vulgaris]|uniref:Uncharacterized protein n=1 Tax=Octopus vulgaris TaxID=6645 RepID=A0AA36ARX2_OCTVU|nr:Hypothetical predicted protein [Octopus vulgaris]